jgi:hypothetical protein
MLYRYKANSHLTGLTDAQSHRKVLRFGQTLRINAIKCALACYAAL